MITLLLIYWVACAVLSGACVVAVAVMDRPRGPERAQLPSARVVRWERLLEASCPECGHADLAHVADRWCVVDGCECGSVP